MGVRMGVEPWHQNYDKTIICLVVSTYPSEKYESQMEFLFPIYIYIWKNNPAMIIRSGYLKTCCFLDALQEVHSDFSQSVSFPASCVHSSLFLTHHLGLPDSKFSLLWGKWYSFVFGIWLKAGWWLTYPSEKWWSSSVGMMKFPMEK